MAAEVEHGDRRKEPSLKVIEAARLEVDIDVSVLEPVGDLLPLQIEPEPGHRPSVWVDQRLGEKRQQTRPAWLRAHGVPCSFWLAIPRGLTDRRQGDRAGVPLPDRLAGPPAAPGSWRDTA